MSEPPIIPGPDYRSELPNDNPFAPSTTGFPYNQRAGKVSLSGSYWIALGVLLGGSLALSTIGFPLGWPGMLIVSAAAIRVPFMQRRHFQEHSGRRLPNAFTLLFTSLAMMIVFAVVAFIAFAAVCIPGSIAFGGDGSYPVAGISGAVGLLCFGLQFFLSLRLRF